MKNAGLKPMPSCLGLDMEQARLLEASWKCSVKKTAIQFYEWPINLIILEALNSKILDMLPFFRSDF